MKTKSLSAFGIQWGVICGIFCVIAIMLLYIMGITYIAGFMRFTPLIIYYVLFVVAASQLRKQKGGYISFKDVFVMLIFCSLTAIVINLIFGYILYTIIDPNLPDEIKKYWMDWTFNMMNGKVPEEKIQETLKEMESKDYGMSLKNVSIGLVAGLIGDAIVILIISAIIKRKNPMEELRSSTSTDSAILPPSV